MTNWEYLIPTVRGSHWDKPIVKGRSNTVTDPDLPRIGVYCPHDPHPWLVGSLVVSAAVWEAKREVLWSWVDDYMCGDGTLIKLGRQQAEAPFQQIVDDAPYDREKNTRRLREAELGSPEMQAALDESNHADRVMRTRFVPKCKDCGMGQPIRSDKAQPVAQGFWDAHQREITLSLFLNGVSRSRA